jgi:ABC-2 type transport system ATP-binding protein
MNTIAVEVNHLTVQFDQFKAVDDISFTVGSGEIFGFLGANGAGKTTTIRVLCGLLAPTSGKASILGLNDLNQIKKRIGYMSQKFTLYEDLTIEENIDFTASLHKMKKEIMQERTKYLFDFIHYDQSNENRNKALVKDLPLGIKQQMALVCSLLHDPDIIFLDEPTAGVSPRVRLFFWDLIKKLSQSGKTIFVTTHYMDEAENCERIALMRNGKIIALDSPENLKVQTNSQSLEEVFIHIVEGKNP